MREYALVRFGSLTTLLGLYAGVSNAMKAHELQSALQKQEHVTLDEYRTLDRFAIKSGAGIGVGILGSAIIGLGLGFKDLRRLREADKIDRALRNTSNDTRYIN